eukprot:TRINITY_DN2988_c0_g1_i1.p1 TRINITY_DN2988_c0_g1~~TRINITY_DN2988_c0_g1_i1.p1  ORF type:complete len:364 (-),score=95.19 TRINITY_DN2988_c0_g1_i1:28-993(-)
MGEELGRGSFSIVYKAISIADGSERAVKVVDKIKLGPKKMEMIETEVEILARVSHPNVIKLEEVYDTNERVFLVMEIIRGGELFDKIVELHSYTEKDASILVTQILAAVDHLHENGITHRDLKPENLFLSSKSDDAQVKVGDFGLSTFLAEDKSLLTKAVGTPGYIAPEILQTLDGDLLGYSKEVDLWSVGVIMYILLCGFPPFYAEDDDEAFDQIIAGHFEYPKPYWNAISDSAKDLINHLLVVDAKKRFTAKQALQHPWITANTHMVHLPEALEQLKHYNAKKKWKKGINTVLAMGKFRNGIKDMEITRKHPKNHHKEQ